MTTVLQQPRVLSLRTSPQEKACQWDLFPQDSSSHSCHLVTPVVPDLLSEYPIRLWGASQATKAFYPVEWTLPDNKDIQIWAGPCKE